MIKKIKETLKSGLFYLLLFSPSIVIFSFLYLSQARLEFEKQRKDGASKYPLIQLITTQDPLVEGNQMYVYVRLSDNTFAWISKNGFSVKTSF